MVFKVDWHQKNNNMFSWLIDQIILFEYGNSQAILTNTISYYVGPTVCCYSILGIGRNWKVVLNTFDCEIAP